MSDVPCPFCRQPVARDATVCHHCHSKIGFADIGLKIFGWGLLLAFFLLVGSCLWR